MEPPAWSVQLGLLTQAEIDEILNAEFVSRCYFFNDSFSF